MSLRLVIADDHSVVLDGLRALLALEPDIDLVAACADGVEALEAVAQHQPDVLVVDAAMPRCGGLQVHETLRAGGVVVRTILLSATIDDETLVTSLRADVDGIVLKESAASVLIEAITAVARGERWIPTKLSARAAELASRAASGPEDGLTPRERQVVQLVARGMSNKRVATQLQIGESTVKLHLHSAFSKLQVRNRTQLSLLARARGWI